jgi:sarcosine oxidase
MATGVRHEQGRALTGDDLNADVCIVGAGFTGLRAAVALAEGGASVIVLDAGGVGWGASGRNGGQVNPMPHNTPEMLRGMLDTTYFERFAEATLGSADELFEFIRERQIDCQARQNGWVRAHHTDAARREVETAAREWERLGADLGGIEGEALFKLTGTRAYKSGTLHGRGGAVQPLSLARGVAKVAIAAGAQIFERSAVRSLAQTDTGWRVATADGSIRAKWVVLATNGYTDGLLAGLKKTVLPVVSAQIATEPLDDAIVGDILPGGQTIADTRRVVMYSRREPDKRMVFGGVGQLGRDGVIRGHDDLIKDAERIWPALRGVNWRYRWGGQLAITVDHLPHLHEPEKGLLVGFGYNGRGVAMSHVMGRVLAERILGADPASLAFPVTGVKGIPFHGLQMMGVRTGVWWMKLRDRLEMRLG